MQSPSEKILKNVSLKKTENNNLESGTNEKQEIVELPQESSAKKYLNDIVCRKQSVKIKTRDNFQEAPRRKSLLRIMSWILRNIQWLMSYMTLLTR